VLAGKPRRDQSLVDFLDGRGYPVVDVRDAFAAEHALLGGGEPHAFLRKYFIGHATPAGNFFTAWAIKDAVVQWLDPKPLPYDPSDRNVTQGVKIQQAVAKPTLDVQSRRGIGR
jgi:hypothetical protein